MAANTPFPPTSRPIRKVNDITKPRPVTEEFCRKELTSYEVYSLRKAEPIDDGPQTWMRVDITQEFYELQTILENIQALEKKGPTINEKMNELSENMGKQVDNLLHEKNSQENGKPFIWMLCQLQRIMKKKITNVLVLYFKRVPRQNANVMDLYNIKLMRNRQSLQGMPPVHGPGQGYNQVYNIQTPNRLGHFEPNILGAYSNGQPSPDTGSRSQEQDSNQLLRLPQPPSQPPRPARPLQAPSQLQDGSKRVDPTKKAKERGGPPKVIHRKSTRYNSDYSNQSTASDDGSDNDSGSAYSTDSDPRDKRYPQRQHTKEYTITRTPDHTYDRLIQSFAQGYAMGINQAATDSLLSLRAIGFADDSLLHSYNRTTLTPDIRTNKPSLREGIHDPGDCGDIRFPTNSIRRQIYLGDQIEDHQFRNSLQDASRQQARYPGSFRQEDIQEYEDVQYPSNTRSAYDNRRRDSTLSFGTWRPTEFKF